MKNLTLIFALLFVPLGVCPQNVGVNATGAAPDPSAILDVESTTGGFLMPRMTSVQRDAILNPAEGLWIYNIDTHCPNYHNGSLWVELCGNPILPTFTNCGDDFTDLRDSTIYGTVLIGSQCWMDKNLEFDTTGSWYYNNDPTYAVYGRLYNWNTAMSGNSSSNTNPSGVRGVCPSGWHLPSDSEWQQLIVAIGGVANGGNLKSTLTATGIGSWANPNIGATNLYGFSALPGGSGPPFINAQNNASFWASTEVNVGESYQYILDSSSPDILQNTNFKIRGLSVRCLKD